MAIIKMYCVYLFIVGMQDCILLGIGYGCCLWQIIQGEKICGFHDYAANHETLPYGLFACRNYHEPW